MIVDRGMQLEGKDVHLYTHKHVYQLYMILKAKMLIVWGTRTGMITHANTC